MSAAEIEEYSVIRELAKVVKVQEKQIDGLNVEAERLARQHNVAVERMRTAEYRESELQAENDRLRASLQQLTDALRAYMVPAGATPTELWAQAKAALEHFRPLP